MLCKVKSILYNRTTSTIASKKPRLALKCLAFFVPFTNCFVRQKRSVSRYACSIFLQNRNGMFWSATLPEALEDWLEEAFTACPSALCPTYWSFWPSLTINSQRPFNYHGIAFNAVVNLIAAYRGDKVWNYNNDSSMTFLRQASKHSFATMPSPHKWFNKLSCKTARFDSCAT